jgi:hypothetical protein
MLTRWPTKTEVCSMSINQSPRITLAPPDRPSLAPAICSRCLGQRRIKRLSEQRSRHALTVACPHCSLLTPERIDYYLSRKGVVCPFCFDLRIAATGTFEVDGATAWQEISCEVCDRSWRDRYTLSDAAGTDDGCFR